MSHSKCILIGLAFFISVSKSIAAEAKAGENPADHLPAHITRLTSFGERADWSADGKKLLFLSKTFGDALELDLETKQIRNLTAHYPHRGYARALYLVNGDILLSGPEVFDPKKVGEARVQCFLAVLDKSFSKPAFSLGTKCSEGPAVSRKRMHIAWTHVAAEYPDDMPAGSSRMWEADIIYENGLPKLAGQKLIIDSRDLPFKCTMETQNFRPPDEKELTFSAYGYQGTDVCGVDLTTKKVVDYSNSPGQYDEPEGIFPDGQFTLVECDKQNLKGPGYVDLWKLKLDGSGQYQRLTFFSDYPGFKASNPVVSDDGQFFAFQMAKSREAAGVGHGIFLYDIEKAKSANRPLSGVATPLNSKEDFDRLMTELSNWGRWGKEDQLGAMNLITPATRKRALALVREGVSVSLARDAEKEKAPDNGSPFIQVMNRSGTNNPGFSCADTYTVSYHGMAHTHIDSLCHMFYQGKMYNGFSQSEVTETGAQKLGIQNLKQGILSRGVLIDIPNLKNLDFLEPGAAIYPEDLEAWEQKTGIRVGAGDIVLIRTGRWARRAALGAWGGKFAGLHGSCARWLKDRDVSIVGSDAASDVVPSGIDDVPMPIHQLSLIAMGACILDNCDLEAISAAAKQRKRWEFLLTIAPLAVPGGTGSPVNPIATF